MRNKGSSTRRFRGWEGIVLVAFVVLAAMPASARAAQGKRIAVLPPSGGTAKDNVIVTKISKALKAKKIKAVSGAPVKKVLAKVGDPSTDSDWMALARKLRVDGALELTISGSGNRRRVEVAVHNGADGSVSARETFAAKGAPAKLAAAAAGGLWRKLGTAIEDTTPPARGDGMATRSLPPSDSAPAPAASESPLPGMEREAEPAEPAPTAARKAAKEPEEEAEEEPEEGERKEAGMFGPREPTSSELSERAKARRSREPRSLEVEVGARILHRVFQYTPANAGPGYSQSFMPTLQTRLSWFPITNLGALLAFEYNPKIAINSTPSYPGGTRELIAGLQARMPLSYGVVGASASFFQHAFVIGDTSDSSDAARSSLGWPDVVYQGARIALNARFYVTKSLQVGAEAAYRLVTSPGENGLRVRSSYYFPDGKATLGLDGVAFGSFKVLSWLELRAAIDYRRYSFGELRAGPENERQINATGASDQYVGVTLGAVGFFGGR